MGSKGHGDGVSMRGFKQRETCILIKGWEIKIKKCGVNAVEGPLRETASSSETWWISSIRTCGPDTLDLFHFLYVEPGLSKSPENLTEKEKGL